MWINTGHNLSINNVIFKGITLNNDYTQWNSISISSPQISLMNTQLINIEEIIDLSR